MMCTNMWCIISSTRDTRGGAEFLIFLIKHYRLYVILDCWSAHTTNKLVEKLKGHAITLLAYKCVMAE